jgi:hypothetical protein
MERKLLHALARYRRVLLEIHGLPPGTLPPHLDEAVEDLVAPGFRDRLAAVLLASLPPAGGRPS